MNRMFLVLFVAATVFWPAGCSNNYAPAPSPKENSPAEKSATPDKSAPAQAQPAAVPAEDRSEPSEQFVPADVPESKPADTTPRREPIESPDSKPWPTQPGEHKPTPSEPAPSTPAPSEPAPSKPAPSESTQPAPPAGKSIDLSTGVALPQTGPEGTMMMFSVDYEFAAGEPNAKAGYVWVIERTKGAPTKKPVQLKTKGTLEAAVYYWRPEEGPFRSHIEDRKGKRLSESIDMKR